jgi:hypothetical protein
MRNRPEAGQHVRVRQWNDGKWRIQHREANQKVTDHVFANRDEAIAHAHEQGWVARVGREVLPPGQRPAQAAGRVEPVAAQHPPQDRAEALRQAAQAARNAGNHDLAQRLANEAARPGHIDRAIARGEIRDANMARMARDMALQAQQAPAQPRPAGGKVPKWKDDGRPAHIQLREVEMKLNRLQWRQLPNAERKVRRAQDNVAWYQRQIERNPEYGRAGLQAAQEELAKAQGRVEALGRQRGRLAERQAYLRPLVEAQRPERERLDREERARLAAERREREAREEAERIPRRVAEAEERLPGRQAALNAGAGEVQDEMVGRLIRAEAANPGFLDRNEYAMWPAPRPEYEQVQQARGQIERVEGAIRAQMPKWPEPKDGWPPTVGVKPGKEAVNLGGGVNGSYRTEFANGDIGVYKPADKEGANYRAGQDWGQWKAEIGAYRIDQALKLGVVPPTEQFNGVHGNGALQVYAKGAQRGKSEAYYGNLAYSADEHARMAVLDYLTDNPDRHYGNYMTGASGHVIAIDNGLGIDNRIGIGNMHGTYGNVFAKGLGWDKGGGREMPADLKQAIDNVDKAALRSQLESLGFRPGKVDGVMERLEALQTKGTAALSKDEWTSTHSGGEYQLKADREAAAARREQVARERQLEAGLPRPAAAGRQDEQQQYRHADGRAHNHGANYKDRHGRDSVIQHMKLRHGLDDARAQRWINRETDVHAHHAAQHRAGGAT